MSIAADALTVALADRYRLERELGHGGMATVYLAHDLRHERKVAIKVLRPELAAVIGAERFVREIRTLAALQHPYILGLIDSGEVQGTAYYVMPFVDGESLRDRLRREPQLPLVEAVRITAQVASALDYAHRRGVIHRDIKPDNILLHEGEAMLADFGIALAIAEAADQRLTETGLSLGTPHYMSPEQAMGDREITTRSDIYSLGAVLYEMLAGEPPFIGHTAQAIVAKVLTERPTSLRNFRNTIPAAVETAVDRALARAPVDRFATAGELALAVVTGAAGPLPAGSSRGPSRMVAVLGLGFLLGLGALFAWRAHGRAEPADAVRRIAVLPFDNLGDSSQAYFADGVSDAVRSKLTAVPGVAVIARTSSVQYRGAAFPADIARDLGVRYLLTGTVRWAKAPGGGSRVQVTPELIELTEAAPVSRWSQSFDGSLTEVFELQADVAARVADALGIALGAGQRTALERRPTRNLAAYDDFLRGEAIYTKGSSYDPAALLQADAWYRRAIEGDSGFALAWARLGSVRNLLWIWDNSARRDREAREAVERALSLAPDLADAHVSLAEYLWNVKGDDRAALAAARRAHELNPGDPDAFGLMANLETSDSQVIWLQRARDMDPRSILAANRLAEALLDRRRYDEAWQEAERGLAFAPASAILVRTKVFVRLARGDRAGAQGILQEALLRSGPAAHLPRYWDVYWMLTHEQLRAFLDLPATSWPGWQYRTGILAIQAFAIGDSALGRAYSDSAIVGITGYLKENPNRAFNYWARGLHFANLGRMSEARADRDRAAALLDRSWVDPVIMAWLDVRIGDKASAVTRIAGASAERVSYPMSRAWLRIDDRFAPLRGYPPFDSLVAAP